MSRRSVRLISLIVAVITLGMVLAGCGTKEDEGNSTASSQSVSTQSASSNQGSGPVYPLKTNVTLKYWTVINANVQPNYKSLGDTPFAKELMKQTGINIEFIHPPVGQENDVFNLMLASGDLPDIIEYDINGKVKGGADNAIKQGYVLKLNDVIEQYSPNLKAILEENPDFEKLMKTDSGSIYNYPMFRDFNQPEKVLSTQGPIVRKDWLDELGLPVPTTLDEWETMLRAFKDKKGATAPLSFTGTGNQINAQILDSGYFISDYIVTRQFYHDGNTVKWGILDPKYKDAIEMLSRWYKEGLLDKNVFSTDGTLLQSNVLSGKTGATIGWGSANIRTWLTTMKDKDPKFDLAGAPNPTINKGDKPKFGRTSPFVDTFLGSAISGKCKNIEAAARLLDYGYSKEGNLLMNYGIEGTSYTMVNGEPAYTDLILNNPDKLPMGQAQAAYSRGVYNGPLIQQGNIFVMVPQQADALAKWYNTDAQKYVMYGVTATPEESSLTSKIESDINTYHDEMIIKFIMGLEPMSNFDKFQAQLKTLGADTVVQTKQAQYDRFIKR